MRNLVNFFLYEIISFIMENIRGRERKRWGGREKKETKIYKERGERGREKGGDTLAICFKHKDHSVTAITTLPKNVSISREKWKTYIIL